MVRLLLSLELHDPENPNDSFNPTMVRLLPAVGWLSGRRRLMFQSHNGAIAARVMAVKAVSLTGSFNPTMVRLLPAFAPSYQRK